MTDEFLTELDFSDPGNVLVHKVGRVVASTGDSTGGQVQVATDDGNQVCGVTTVDGRLLVKYEEKVT